MKSLIVYFSSTGNTKFLCELVAKGIQNRGGACDIVKFDGAKDVQFENYDIAGWAAPVFDWRPALILQDAVKSVKKQDKKPAFMLTTFGGSFGNTYHIMAGWLRKNGFMPVVHHGMQCEDNWTVLRPDTKSDSVKKNIWRYGCPTQEMVNEAIKFGESLPQVLESFKKNELKIPEYGFIPTPTYLISLFYNRPLLRRTSGIKVDLSKCTKCLVCVKNCPTGKMKIESFPKPKGYCIGCYSCINLCPENCVSSWFTRGKVQFKGLDKNKYRI